MSSSLASLRQLVMRQEASPLENLTQLRQLWLGTANCEYESDLKDISCLEKLLQLESLTLDGTKVADLSVLKNLKNLRTLDIARTQVTGLEPLSGLRSLRSLYLCDTDVADLSPLAKLNSLRVLDISNTPVGDLTPLRSHRKLYWLNISGSAVTDLSSLPLDSIETLVVGALSSLASILPILEHYPFEVEDAASVPPFVDIQDETGRCNITGRSERTIICDFSCLVDPPLEVVQQGRLAILNYYAERQAQGVDRLYEAKMLIVGEPGAGKTSLLRRLFQPDLPLPSEGETTRGIDIHRHVFPISGLERHFRLNVWDFGGQEIYHATHQFFLTKRSIYVLLDDTRKDYKTIHDEGFKYWLEVIALLSDKSPLLIFQNEKGGRSKTIDLAGIKKAFENVKDLYGADLINEDAADELRDVLEFYARRLPHVGEELPAKWISIRFEIERRTTLQPFIGLMDYFAIYAQYLPFDRTKALLLSRYLHDLGVFLHFQDDALLTRTVILKNEWATQAVFKLLDDEIVKKRLGRFDSADCSRIWCNPEYVDMHPELLALMQKFELCFQLPDSRPATWLATQLLPPSKPESLREWSTVGDLTVRYRYEFMPKGLVSRLIVRLNRFVLQPQLSWATGTLLEHEGTQLLIEVSENGADIVLRAQGPERKAMLHRVCLDLDALNESFHDLPKKVSKWIPCICGTCRIQEPHYFEYRRLIQRKQDGRHKVECPVKYEEVGVFSLLHGVEVTESTNPVFSAPLMKGRSTGRYGTRRLRIFLASSSELAEERDAFDLYLRQQNDLLMERGLYLEVVRWEKFLDFVSETSKQDDYNQEVRQCDLFVCLFRTKVGKFTKEEFHVAHSNFQEIGKPLIYTFFKNQSINTCAINRADMASLWGFQDELSRLGHFHTVYENTEHLKRLFRDQLDQLLPEASETSH